MTGMVERDSAAPVSGAAHEAGRVQVSLRSRRTEGMLRLEPGASFDSENRIAEEVGDEEAAFKWFKPMCWTARARAPSQATENEAVGANCGIAAEVTAHLYRMITEEAGSQLSIEEAADGLGLSVRTLQRRLAEGGLSYSLLRDRVRLEEACRMISSTDARLIDVAYQLGFSGPSHFSRAFQRWMGMAPQHFRRRQRRDKGETGASAQ